MAALTEADFAKYAHNVPSKDLLAAPTRQGQYFLYTGQVTNDVKMNGTYPGAREIDLKKGSGTIWLPYQQSAITCIELPMDGSAKVFLTDNLSGCAIYIGKTDDGRWYACHANSQQGSSEAELAPKKPDFQSSSALSELDKLAKAAAAKLGVKMVGGLSKARYRKGTAKAAPTNADFLGGTTVAGFFADDAWTMLFQSWGSVKGKPLALIESGRFFTTADPKKYA